MTLYHIAYMAIVYYTYQYNKHYVIQFKNVYYSEAITQYLYDKNYSVPVQPPPIPAAIHTHTHTFRYLPPTHTFEHTHITNSSTSSATL